jgi:arylsulfatase A-like enzyme
MKGQDLSVSARCRRTARSFLPCAGAVAFCLLSGGLGRAFPAGNGRPPARVILVSIDTLRFDHLGCTGYPVSTTPHLDLFRRDAVLFSAAVAQASSTLASHASMLTSLLVPQHGASFKRGTALDRAVTTLAEALTRHGIKTISFNEGGQLAPEYGLGRGFSRYRSERVGPGTSHFANEVEQVTRWLHDNPDQPFFMFLHTYAVHHPYTPDARHLAEVEPDPYGGSLPHGETPLGVLEAINQSGRPLAAADLRHIVATYDAQIRAMDDDFAALVALLKARGIYDETTIVFTADHGEEFGEHGWVGWHSHTLYDELVRVPLLIKYPGEEFAGGTVTRQVRSIDIAPTVLALLQIEPPKAFQGSDLTPLVLGRQEAVRYAVSNLDGGGVVAIRSTRWKLIRNHLFDLREDPGETRDVAARFPEVAAWLAARRAALLAALPESYGPPATVSAEAKKSLDALGYVGR